MGYRELIESLKREGEEKANSILDEAHKECESIQRDTEEKIRSLEERYRKRLEETIRKQKAEILRQARLQADKTILLAERELADRAYNLSKSLLPLLREESYDLVFEALVKELPSEKWRIIRVNPGDMRLAEDHFSGTEVHGDESISGGVEVETEDRRIRITNTFEKRLQRLWEGMVSDILKEISRSGKNNRKG